MAVSATSIPPGTPILFLGIDNILFKRDDRDPDMIERKVEELFPEVEKPYKSRLLDSAAVHLFDPVALANLDILIKKVADLRIVIASGWARGYTVPDLKKLFSMHAFSSNIVDKIPDSSDEDYCKFREGKNFLGSEISYWLTKHPQITKYVIFGTVPNLKNIFGDRFIGMYDNDFKVSLNPEIITNFKRTFGDQEGCGVNEIPGLKKRFLNSCSSITLLTEAHVNQAIQVLGVKI